ncbi:MAG: TrmB family transcriptional regulator [Haloarculaceae archaeon]
MNEDGLTDVLEEAGLSPYQASAYVALLELGSAAATVIAERSGVPDPRIYDVLRDLEQAGYVETYEQDALRARIHDFEALQETLESRATRFSAAVEEIERRWEEPEMEQSVVSFVRRFETVLEAAENAIEGAENGVQVATSPEHYRRLRPALRTATENGASVHLSVFTDGDGSSLPDADDVAQVCTEARHRRLPSPFVAVVDRTTVCFAPHAGSTNEYGLIVDDRTHAYVFHWFFLTTQWDIWEPFYATAESGIESDYLDIRYCVRDIEPLLDAGRTVRLRVEGIDTETGVPVTVDGTVGEIVVDPDYGDFGSRPVVTYGGRVALVLETDSGSVGVGGWGALVEDVEAHRLRVLSVE